MPAPAPAQPLFTEDLVRRRSGDDELGIVKRTHGDVDTHTPYPSGADGTSIYWHADIPVKDYRTFLTDGIPPRGSVLVHWRKSNRLHLFPEAELIVADRPLLVGDVVKRNAHDAMSGIVINISSTCVLQPMTGLTLESRGGKRDQLRGILPGSSDYTIKITETSPSSTVKDVPARDLEPADPLIEDALVIYGDWVGTVGMVTCAITLQLADNCVVEIDDDLAEHVDRDPSYFQVGDVATAKKGTLRSGQWIFGRYNPNTPPVGTVVKVRNLSADIAWLQRRIGSEGSAEPPPILERSELESAKYHIYDRTRLPPDFSAAAVPTLSNAEFDYLNLGGLRVRFRDITSAITKYAGRESSGSFSKIDRRDTLGYDLNVFDLRTMYTHTEVQWQDTSITQEDSTALVPDQAIDDDHAAWPGEIVHSLDLQPVPGEPSVLQPAKVGVVQSVNAAERMAQVRWCHQACVQYTNEEEDLEKRVLIAGVIGLASGEPESISLYDVEAPGSVNVRRGDLVLVSKTPSKPQQDGETSNGIDWIGEIVDTCPDGSLTIRLGAAHEVRDINLKREEVVVVFRSDTTIPTDAWSQDHGMDEDDSMGDNSSEWSDESLGSDSLGGTSRDTGMGSDAEVRYEDENGQPMDAEDVKNDDWESDEDDDDNEDESMHLDAPPGFATPPPVTTHNGTKDEVMEADSSLNPSEAPEPYQVLDGEVPASHHFVSDAPSQSAAHMKRCLKEHKILRSSGALPGGVYVRTWESRLDLLRVLIIGPAETPYADAPFVVDFSLGPSFPTEPPAAFFHSWPSEGGLGGIGRANPNLYEDGKICLSILGTWEGSSGEGWNASRSTLLQVIVSILGLVLVREPYFNEAGYEHLTGLESSRRPSAIYSERILLRAKTFVICALNRIAGDDAGSGGCEGVADILRWLYRGPTGPKLLQKSICNCEEVLRESEEGGREPNGLTIASKGACIPLRRVLERLRSLQ